MGAIDETSKALGEITGQLRELIHMTVNLQTSVNALGLRVAKLEAAENQRLGERGLLKALGKSPIVAWVISVAVAAWAVVNHKV